jgi:hypothetical protein
MRALAWIVAIVAGVIVLSAIVAAATGNGRNDTGKTVKASGWANDVCGVTGAWQGELKDIRDELRDNNYAARRIDGGSGDNVEETITLRGAVDRAIRATTDTLQEGLKRSGIPDANKGAQASALLLDWSLKTETNLRIAKAQLQAKPTSPAEAFAALGPPVRALSLSALQGRAAFNQAAALDPALSDALAGSRNCDRLKTEQP